MPDKVSITKSKLDSLADAISSKFTAGSPLTIDQMESAIEDVQIEPLTVTPSTTEQVFEGYSLNPVVSLPTGIYNGSTQSSSFIAEIAFDFSSLVVGKTYWVEGSITVNDNVIITISGKWVYTLTSLSTFTHSDSLPFSPTQAENNKAPTLIQFREYNSGWKTFSIVFSARYSQPTTNFTVNSAINFYEANAYYLPVTVAPIPSQYIIPTGTKTITENGTGIDVAQYANVDVSVSGGGVAELVPEKWVNFIDYNGDILYSYTKSEIANLTALPANPSHSGLVSQGWNWTLAEIQAEVLAGTTKIWVGQSYGTVSGATEIDIELTDPNYLSPYLAVQLTGSTGLTVDWGDDSTPYSNTTTGAQYIQHTFPTVGKYTIKISISDNTKWHYFYNTQGNNHCSILLVAPQNDDTTRNMIYANAIKAIRVGDRFYLANGAFRTLNNVEYITIPNTIRNVNNPSDYKIGYYPFAQCCSLKSITLPSEVIINTSGSSYFEQCYRIKNVSMPASVALDAVSFYSNCRGLVHPHIPSGTTAIPNNCFYQSQSITDIVLPSSLTTIGNNAFNSCQSITEITIPASVTSIGNDAFRYNYGLLAYHFLSTTPPTLGNSTVFGGINANCKIYVPSASVNAYKTATNWSTYASYIEEEPQ